MIKVVVDYTCKNDEPGDIAKEISLDEIDYIFTVGKDDLTSAGVIADDYIGQAWSEITEGSRLFFKKGIVPEIDDIVLAYIADSEFTDGHQHETVIRHYEPHLDCLFLRSSNKNYEDIMVCVKTHLKVLGVCIAAQYRPTGGIEARELIRRGADELPQLI